MRFYTIFCLCAVLFLGACTEAQFAAHVIKQLPRDGQSKSVGTFKVGNPYQIFGVWYTPQESYNFSETGIASWYGPNFHGKATANGEIFDMNDLTAAHRTLQLPSIVRVTNLENGRSLIVRVNDRGPFKRGRVLDLSRRSAELLGTIQKGTAKVKIQLLPEESRAIAEIAKRGEDTRGFEIALNEDRERGLRLLNERAGFAQATPEATDPIQIADNLPPPKEQQNLGTLRPEDIVEAPATQGNTAAVTDVEIKTLEPLDMPPQPAAPESITKPETTPVDPAENLVKKVAVPDTNIYIQAGSFGNEANAQRLVENLAAQGKPAQIYPATVNGKQYFRVRLGPLESVDSADTMLLDLNEGGNAGAMIIVQ